MMEEIHNFVFQLINNAFDMAAAESEDKREKDRNTNQNHRAKIGLEESKVNSSNSLTETTSKQPSKVTVEDLG